MPAKPSTLFALVLIAAALSTSSAAEPIAFERLRVSDETFERPHDLLLSADGKHLYVADVGNDVVKVLDPDTLATVGHIGGDVLSSPHDVAFDGEGRLLVADSGNDRTVVFEVTGPQGHKVAVWGGEQASPEGVAVAADGRVYVTNAAAHTVLVLRQGRIVRRLGQHGDAPDRFVRPHDIHVDSRDRVLIVDPGNNRIQVRDLELRLLRTLKGPGYDFNEPKYVTVDAAGWLYVADEYNNQVKVFDADFRPVATLGDGQAGKGPNRLRKPEGVEVRGDRLWVSDTYNDRIVLYRVRR
jgi:YVTN family beta-propeller protein